MLDKTIKLKELLACVSFLVLIFIGLYAFGYGSENSSVDARDSFIGAIMGSLFTFIAAVYFANIRKKLTQE